MISDDKLKEFFLDGGTPNWSRYCDYYNRILMGSLIGNLEIRNSLIDVLEHVDFYLCLRGFLTIRGGSGLVDCSGSSLITFNKINNQKLRFVREEDAEEVGKIIQPFGYNLK